MKVSELQDKKQILFVDDEPHVLGGLRRSLHSVRDEWDIYTAPGGAEALEFLKTKAVDMVVSDLRMPGMDGVELLNTIQHLHPQMIRFVLSGYADRFMILRCAGPAHKFLVKPCEIDSLVKSIRRAFALRDLLNSHSVQKVIETSTELPALPSLYVALMNALQSRDSSMAQIASIIDSDAALSGKLLHLVNSTFFGYIQSIPQAVSYLGAEAMSAIALTAALFAPYLNGSDDEFGIQANYDHSVSVGATAGRWIAKVLKDRKLSEETTMAGMTHDIGKLVLIRNRPDDWRKAIQFAADKNLPLHAAEREVFDTTHAEIGAYLLNRWGVADNIVEAVAYHHHPANSLGREQNSLFAVHVANALCHKWHEPGKNWRRLLDNAYLAAVDPAWNIDAFEADAGKT